MLHMTKLKKWQLLETKDVSPSKWFPLEKRKYQTSDGKIVENFYVCTLADSAHVIPITVEGKVVMIRMYKPGVDDIVIQFPAGRFEAKHTDMSHVAMMELEEETGIKVESKDLIPLGKFAVMTTKSSEYAHAYIAKNVVFTPTLKQKLDDTEEIEVILLSPQEIDEMILKGEIAEGLTIADWYLLKTKFPELLKL